MSDSRDAKKLLRSSLRARLAAVSAADVATWSGQIVARIESLPEYASARTVLMFVPMAGRPEVDLRPLMHSALAAGKTVCLPRTDWATRTMVPRRIIDPAKDLEADAAAPAAAGLSHPRESCPAIPPEDLDLLCTPGLGFDLSGGRIGHGAGFYDRFLARFASAPNARPLVCGIGFEVQVLPEGQILPGEPHDHPLDALITEARTIRFRGSARRGTS